MINPGILLAFKKPNQIVKKDPIGFSHSKRILSGILQREKTEVAEELSFSGLLSVKKPLLSSEYIPNNILVLWIKSLQILFS